MFYVSTCRKPVAQTRSLAKWFARLFGGYYENRGKRNLDELMGRASAQGFSRIMFIYERHGNPSELTVYDEEKGWLSPEIRVQSVKLPPEGERAPRVPPRAQIVFEGGAEKAQALFEHAPQFAEEGGLDKVVAKISSSTLSFSYKGIGVGPVLKIELREFVPKQGESE